MRDDRDRLILALGLLAFLASNQAAGQNLLGEEPEFLPVDEAFVLSAEVDDDGTLVANWEISEGYYLYRHRFGFKAREESSPRLGELKIAPGKEKVDEYFGTVEVYYQDARARVPIQAEGGPLEVGISYQGCAEAGLCYPPQTRWVAVEPEAGTVTPVAPRKR